ncbi:MAG: MarR family transcriptional regulator [Chloroflexi bacterium]|nr:MarR family transcriptional regulator [Chloroflexota bacterium]
MKPLDNETNFSAEALAAALSDTVPLVMRNIRADMRTQPGLDLSVPQFRTLLFLRRHPGASLSEVAEHIGLTLPTISKMIDRLEGRNLLARLAAAHDRRRTSLELTPHGIEILKAASDTSRERLARQLLVLTDEQRAHLIEAMHILRGTFSSESTLENDTDQNQKDKR